MKELSKTFSMKSEDKITKTMFFLYNKRILLVLRYHRFIKSKFDLKYYLCKQHTFEIVELKGGSFASLLVHLDRKPFFTSGC